MTFDAFFERATEGLHPYAWQAQAAEDGLPDLVTVPTGMGKTEGVVLAWAWRALVRKDATEPRHLAYCLPMRVLVRQTAERLGDCFRRLRQRDDELDVGVFTLMGGQVDDEWAGCPDRPWVLVGTQDQLLSRALNRGYAMSRYDWPVHFGLLNNDCRWIVDEVQLMGPGLWTTAQLDWMRRVRFGTQGPCPTTWMSATLGQSFLVTTDRERDGVGEARSVLTIGGQEHDSPPQAAEDLARRKGAVRPVEVIDPPGTGSDRSRWLAEQVVEAHVPGTLSLVVCNTVAMARAVYDRLPKNHDPTLLTSRFRPRDRAAAEARLYKFERRRRAAGGASVPNDPGLVCVSTQVIEAGVDLSAHRLWSEIAPWPSVVQRLGRLNRDGRDPAARAAFWPPEAGGPKSKRVGPYAKDDVDLGHEAAEGAAGAVCQRPRAAGARRPRRGSAPRGRHPRAAYTADPDAARVRRPRLVLYRP